MSSIRQFKQSRKNRSKFRSLQKKVWSVRQSNFAFKKNSISKKNRSQLCTLDQKAILALLLSNYTEGVGQ